jgi:membrane-bound ClpP family serine protease
MDWAVAAGIALLVMGVVYLLVRPNRAAPEDPTGTIGLEGEAAETFTSSGLVLVRGELWRATAKRGIVQKGERIRVLKAGPGLTLIVERVEAR